LRHHLKEAFFLIAGNVEPFGFLAAADAINDRSRLEFKDSFDGSSDD